MMTVNGGCCETGSENFPSMSAVVPVVVPFMTIVAPIIASPVRASVMVPLSVWEKRLCEKSKMKIRISLLMWFQIYRLKNTPSNR